MLYIQLSRSLLPYFSSVAESQRRFQMLLIDLPDMGTYALTTQKLTANGDPNKRPRS
jgi:hypothetical protein